MLEGLYNLGGLVHQRLMLFHFILAFDNDYQPFVPIRNVLIFCPLFLILSETIKVNQCKEETLLFPCAFHFILIFSAIFLRITPNSLEDSVPFPSKPNPDHSVRELHSLQLNSVFIPSLFRLFSPELLLCFKCNVSILKKLHFTTSKYSSISPFSPFDCQIL